MKLYAGIDGGQSSTTAAIGDEHRILARGCGPPADLVGEARDSMRQAAALEGALAAGLDAAHLPRATRFSAIVAGLSGFDRGISPEPDFWPRTGCAQILHDTEIAHAGALDGGPGIVVIAGTGSVALGNAEPDVASFVRAGGWGYFFGDEGSALWIARSALRSAMYREDRGEPSALAVRALAFLGADSLREVQHAFAHGEIARPALAAFASDVFACAAEDDADAAAVVREGAAALAALAAVVAVRLDRRACRVSYSGGLFEDGAFVNCFTNALAAALPGAQVALPAYSPAAGALLLARRLP